MAHPHEHCTVCQEDRQAAKEAFVAACLEIFRASPSFQDLYDKLVLRGFKVTLK